jgi:hypothetical protein
MKLLILLLFPVTVFAQVMVTPNKADGEIVLTMRPCINENKEVEGLFEAYSWGVNAPKLDGCWALLDGNIHVVFKKLGDVHVYPINAFKRRD